MTRADDDTPLTQAELSVLGPLAEHRILTVPQFAVLLGVSPRTAERRVARLSAAGMVRAGRIFEGMPAAVSISRAGLRRAGSELRQPPRVNLNQYRHEVGVGWLWLAARAGSLGELTQLTAERRMRAHDAAALSSGARPPWGLGLGILGPHGTPLRHYPDLMLDTASGHRVAVELELSAKSRRRMTQIMRAYASDARVDRVLYLVAGPAIGALVESAARAAGIGERVHVQLLAADGVAGAELGRLRGARQQRARSAQRAQVGAGRSAEAAL